MTSERRRPPIVYSCSGSSNVAQLANHLAVRLDRAGLAEMSCIVGVGGDVKPLVKKATSGAPIVLIDGCPLRCCEHVLSAKGIRPTHAIRLHERGLRKVQHVDFTQEERDDVYHDVLAEIAPILLAPGAVAHEPSLDRRDDPEAAIQRS
jgi:uncharacterized metal-binding protein